MSCNQAPVQRKKIDFLKLKTSAQEKMKRLLLEGHPELPLSKKERESLVSFYKTVQYQPFFGADSLSTATKANWTQTLQKLPHFGLPAKRGIKLDSKQHFLINELLLCYQIGTLTHDLDSGFIDFEKRRFRPKTWQKFPTEWFHTSVATDSILLTRGPTDTNYHCFAQHLYHFCDTARLDTLRYLVVTEKEDKALAWKQLKTALIGLGYIKSNSDSLAIRAALKNYQRAQGLNPDARIGSSTSLAFKRASQDKLFQAQIALDQLRQAQTPHATFVRINLPSFELFYVADDTLRAIHKVIVGKIEHPTPELQSKITQIVSLPFWRVPSSIAKNEILPALKRNAAYLQKEHMRIYAANKKEIDPKTVSWKKIKDKTFPYLIEQDPGPWNSLGLIKFEFANSFSVYVHDTPSRYLFGQKFRSFSHGCMRADAPIELGKLLLTHDKKGDQTNEVSPDSLQVLIDQSVHQKIRLLHPIPITVCYQTVTADKLGLYFYLDLYERQQDLIALFRSQNNG
ncbi:MAG: L,D-transpeptidase family protein [Flavobacteriales bacterium]